MAGERCAHLDGAREGRKESVCMYICAREKRSETGCNDSAGAGKDCMGAVIR